MAAEHAITLGGHRLTLLGERAVHWPAQGALLIADLHLGKADVLRRAGILTPRGNTSHDLERLAALLERHRPERLWVLGDLLHGPIHDAPWLARWRAFRDAHRALAIEVVAGNHDRRLDGTTASELGVQRHGDAVAIAGLCLCHEPAPDVQLPTVSGHLHPCVKLPGLPRRWPVFRFDAHSLVLPAFSRLTGGTLVVAREGGWVACVEGEVVGSCESQRNSAALAPAGGVLAGHGRSHDEPVG